MLFPNDYHKQSGWITVLLVFLTLPFTSHALAGDLLSTICRNAVVSVGDRKGEVMAKCGSPLSKTQEAEASETSQIQHKKKTAKKQAENNQELVIKKKKVKERVETWTYNIDGSYRFFIFKEGRLARIETGGLAD